MENGKQYFEINYVDIYKSIKNTKGMSFEEIAENTLNAMKKAINECNDKYKVVERFKKNLLYEAEIDKVLSKETVGQKEETNYIKICNTPDVFKSIGLEDKDITIN